MDLYGFLLPSWFTRCCRSHRWALLFVFLTASYAFSQSSAVNGHIADSSGAAVQGAQVTIISKGTNQAIEVRTNGDGYFLFPPVNPGVYVVHAAATGFTKETIDNVVLEVGGSRTFDLVLKPESVSQDVTVTASAPEMVADNPDRGTVIESELVANTPLNIRNPLQLVNFAQGVTSYSGDSGNNDNSQSLTNTFQINGGKLATSDSLLDGTANTTLYDLNAIAFVPSVDSLDEFKVLTDPYSPEWGRTSAGIVTFASKYGTSNFHGSVWEYLRNSVTDANSFTDDATGTPKPHFERNQYGYALGGPFIIVPKALHEPHRTFFFTSWEGLGQSTAGDNSYTVPTALERTGDFSKTVDANGNLITIYDPASTTQIPVGSPAPCNNNAVVQAGQTVFCRTPFPGNKITNLDPVGKAIMNAFPLPNVSLGFNPATNGPLNYFSASPPTSTQNTVSFRLDHKFNDKHSIFGRFGWFQRWNTFGDPYGNGLSPTNNPQRLPGDNLMVDHTWVINPTTVFEHHWSRALQESNRTPPSLGFNPTSLGYSSAVTAGLPTTTFPTVEAVTGGRLSSIGPYNGLEADTGTTYEYSASLTKLRGKHSLKAGFTFRNYAEDHNANTLVTESVPTPFTLGSYVENSAALATSGSDIADFLLGTGTVSTGIAPGTHIWHQYYAFYGQDQYHITPRLTINYGLRYSIEMPDIEKNNSFQYLSLTAPSPLIVPGLTLTGGPVFVGTNGVSPRLQATQHNNFDPRVGFAYQLNEKTVIRGGFGIFHAASLDATETGQGYSETTTSIPAQANGVVPIFPTPGVDLGNMDNPFAAQTPITGSSLGLATNAGLAVTGNPYQQKNSYSEQWSVDVQRQLPHNLVVTVGYVGNNGKNLYNALNYNQMPDSYLSQGSALLATVANPFYGTITNANSPLSKATIPQWKLDLPHPQFSSMNATLESMGESSYNALQLTVEHRYSQGLAVLFAYTFSHMTDDVGDYETDNDPQDNTCITCEKSTSLQDVPQTIRFSGQYDLPFGKGKPFANQGIASAIAGGWTIGTFYTYSTGLPVQVTENNNTSTFGGGSVMRPNLVPGVSLAPAGGRKIIPGHTTQYFNPAAFTLAPAYTFGNAPRYIDGIRAPGTNNWDVLLGRKIPIKEPFGLSIQLQAFNVFNRIQFSGPTANINSASFGEITPTQVPYTYSRSLQANVRFSF
jgi:Carboxypeptidase regulatory-like domain/TonB dependent receptor